jgi:hypothetical protein
MAFDSTSGPIVDARAVSGLAKGIVGADAEAISALTFASIARLKLQHCMYIVVHILLNFSKTKHLRLYSHSSSLPSLLASGRVGPSIPL